MSESDLNTFFGWYWLVSGIATALIIIAMQYHVDHKITVGDCVASIAFGLFGFVTIFYVLIRLATHFKFMEIVLLRRERKRL